jgi:hypothetical protein
METYMKDYSTYTVHLVYRFPLGAGGIGDYIKFAMFLLEYCIAHSYAFHMLREGTYLENYIQLLYPTLYCTNESLQNPVQLRSLDMFHSLDAHTDYVIDPQSIYRIFDYSFLTIPFREVFSFSDKVIENRKRLLPSSFTHYVSLHLRLGDAFLETDPSYVLCKTDTREFSKEALRRWIETHTSKPVLFFCDSHTYKQQLVERYPNIHILNTNIGHTSLVNTSEEQVLDTVTEFYILTQSEEIVAASKSGFSTVASLCHHTPIHYLY